MQKNTFGTKSVIFLSLIAISYSLIACRGSSFGTTTSYANNSLNNYFSKLAYTPTNSQRLTTNNSPQQSFYVGDSTTFTALDITFYSDNNCSTTVFESTLLPDNGVSFTAPAGTYTSSDASSFAICSLYPGGCTSELNTQSIKYTYHYTSPVAGTTESCLASPSNSLPVGFSGEHIATYTETPAACSNGASCGFSQNYSIFVNPPVVNIAMQFTSLIPNGESATATINETGATAPITVSLTTSNANVSLSSSSCLINAPSVTSCSVQVSGVTITGAPTTITASIASFNLAESIVKVESPVIFITAGSTLRGNLNRFCQGSGCATDPESGVHGGDALCESSASAASLAGTYKALLTASQRYACNSSGNCGAGNNADWPLLASTTYVMSDHLTTFGTTNSAQIFSFAGSKVYPKLFQAAGGYSTATFVWSGTSSIKYSSNDITGWGYNSNNPAVSGNTLSLNTCNDWTSASSSVSGTLGNNNNGSNSALTANFAPTVGWYSNYTAPFPGATNPYFNVVQPFFAVYGYAGSDPSPPFDEGSSSYLYLGSGICSVGSFTTALVCVQQ